MDTGGKGKNTTKPLLTVQGKGGKCTDHRCYSWRKSSSNACYINTTCQGGFHGTQVQGDVATPCPGSFTIHGSRLQVSPRAPVEPSIFPMHLSTQAFLTRTPINILCSTKQSGKQLCIAKQDEVTARRAFTQSARGQTLLPVFLTAKGCRGQAVLPRNSVWRFRYL